VRTLDLPRLTRVALTIIAAWLVVAFFFGTQHMVIMDVRGQVNDLIERSIATTISMLMWACFTPVVVYLADLFPLRRTQRLRSIAILIPITLIVAALRTSFDGTLPMILEGLPMKVQDLHSSVLSLFHTHIFFTVLLIGIANFLRLQREEAERSRNEARFRAQLVQARLWRLRADLHPHFLFNALNSVAAVVHTSPAAARDMLHRLIELLQRSLATRDAREVPLAEELELTASYLAVLKMRFGDRLETSIELEDEALRNAALPPLLLQPLVENAIVHGVAQRIEGGRVAIRIDTRGDSSLAWLRLQVRDTGPGCAPESVYRPEGVGVPNVRGRLESLYGRQQSLIFHRDGDEFVAEIRIPLRGLHERSLPRTA
jgi:signal transduction histidine kinase